MVIISSEYMKSLPKNQATFDSFSNPKLTPSEILKINNDYVAIMKKQGFTLYCVVESTPNGLRPSDSRSSRMKRF